MVALAEILKDAEMARPFARELGEAGAASSFEDAERGLSLDG
jgi:hypothetical protein